MSVRLLPPRPVAAERNSDDFDKKEWVRELKQLRKDFLLEDRERYRPLYNLKRELKEFVEEVEKEEKKIDVTIKKEFSQI